jgi:glycerophosphoryl diester phosphodiesterase
MAKLTFLFIYISVFFPFFCNKDGDTVDACYPTLNGKAPLVIGHRGYPGLLPDHTLQGYALAIEKGADIIEPDLVLTKDCVLIARHEPMLSATTNVADIVQFASKKITRTLDGVVTTDWFACDFTLAEIKELRAKQPFADRDQSYNGLYEIPTFEEVIALVKKLSKKKGRPIGIYPETKHPTFHENLKLPITDKLLQALDKAGWNSSNSPVFVQSFEVSNLKYINSKSSVKIIQLLDAYDVKKDGSLDMTAPNGQPYDFVVAGDVRTYKDLVTDAGLDFIKTYADGIGPWKPYIIPYTFTDANNDQVADDINGDGKVDSRDFKRLPKTNLIERAHQRKLMVHVYTFRDELYRLLSDYKNDPQAEYTDFYKLGVDAVFTDYTATAVAARKKW